MSEVNEAVCADAEVTGAEVTAPEFDKLAAIFESLGSLTDDDIALFKLVVSLKEKSTGPLDVEQVVAEAKALAGLPEELWHPRSEPCHAVELRERLGDVVDAVAGVVNLIGTNVHFRMVGTQTFPIHFGDFLARAISEGFDPVRTNIPVRHSKESFLKCLSVCLTDEFPHTSRDEWYKKSVK